MENRKQGESSLKTWILIFVLLGVILFQGYLCFNVVGDQGQPQWDFDAIRDVPGETPYAIYSLDNPQHVNGQKEEMRVQGGFERN